MAKLTTQLPDVSTKGIGSIGAAPARSDISALAGLASTGIAIASQVQQSNQKAAKEAQLKQEKIEAGQSIGAAQSGVLDLEDERNTLLLQDQQLASQVQAITSDGITPDEEEQLAALEGQQTKLRDARRNGILNPLNFQTRLNALHKQALADVSNQAIQPQINALFAQGRSRVAAPISSAEDKFNQGMDDKYGVGNWSGIDKGRERGRAIYLDQVQRDANNNFQSFVGQESLTFMNIADTQVRQMRKALSSKGALDDTDIDSYNAGINSSTQTVLTQINQAVAQNRANGIPIDQETVKNARQQVLDNQQFYLSFLEKGKEFGTGAQMAQRIDNMNKIVAGINAARNPALASISSAVAGGGSNGDLLSLAAIVEAPESMLQAVVSNLPSSIQIDTNTLRTQAAQAVALAIDGVDFKEAAASGVVNNRLALTVAGVGIKNTSDNPTSFDSYLSTLETTEWQDTKGGLTLLLDPKTVRNVTMNKADQKRLQAVVVHQADNIMSNINADDIKRLTFTDDSVSFTPVAAGARSGRSTNGYLVSTLELFNQVLRTYSKELGDASQYIEEFRRLSEPSFERDVPTGRAKESE